MAKYRLSFPRIKAYDAGLTDAEKIIAWYLEQTNISNFIKSTRTKLGEVEEVFNYVQDKDRFRLIVSVDNKTVEREALVASNRWDLVSMPSQELKFWDQLGYSLSRDAKDITGQNIEDWFKAYDAARRDVEDISVLHEQIRQKLGFERGEETTVSYKLMTELIVNGTGTKYLILQRNKTDGKIMLFEEYGTPASAMKRRTYKPVTEEMRAEMSKLPLKESKPEVVSKLDLESPVIKKFIDEYEKHVAPGEISDLSFDTKDANTLIISYRGADQRDRTTKLFVKINFRSRQAMKSRSLTNMTKDYWEIYIDKFYGWELRLLDLAGLKLNAYHWMRDDEHKQSIEDWFE